MNFYSQFNVIILGWLSYNLKMKKILSINEVKVYSRKEIVAWVQSVCSYSFDELKNGIFFIQILQKLVPQDVSKYKICDKPVNQYQQSLNMNIIKKVLNKHNLQLNMNVQAVIASKNCFELANWFRNLYDQNKSDNDTQFRYSEKSQTPSKNFEDVGANISNYRSLSRATSSDKKDKNKIKKLGMMTSGFVGIKSTDLAQTVKLSKFDSTLTYQLFPNGRDQSSQQLPKSKSRPPNMRQMRSAKSKTKYETQMEMNWTMLSNKKKQPTIPLTEEENIQNLMKIQALQEQITVLEETLKKVGKYVNGKQQSQSIQKMRKQIISIIYQTQNSENGKNVGENQ